MLTYLDLMTLLLVMVLAMLAQAMINRIPSPEAPAKLALPFDIASLTHVDAPGALAAFTTFNLREWAIMAFLVLFCSVFAFAAQLWAIKKTSASRASLLLSTEPIWAVVVGSAIGGELLGWVGYLGAAVIIAASYAGQAIERKHREGKSAA
jgi:drug/metabolite transporter (DMT)-like permease